MFKMRPFYEKIQYAKCNALFCFSWLLSLSASVDDNSWKPDLLLDEMNTSCSFPSFQQLPVLPPHIGYGLNQVLIHTSDAQLLQSYFSMVRDEAQEAQVMDQIKINQTHNTLKK